MNEENILEEWAGCRVINIMCRVSELQIAFEEEKNDYPETFSYKDFKSILNEICIQVQMLYSLLHHGPYVVNGEAKEATDPDVVFLPFAGIFMTAANAKRKTKKKARKEKRLARKYSDIFRKLNKLYSEMEVHDMWKQNSDDKQKINKHGSSGSEEGWSCYRGLQGDQERWKAISALHPQRHRRQDVRIRNWQVCVKEKAWVFISIWIFMRLTRRM